MRKAHPIRSEHRAEMGAQRRAAMRFTDYFFSPYSFYVHIVVYVAWMGLVEHSPWQRFLTYISIEAILAALLIGIGQKTAAQFQAIKADHDWTVQQEVAQTDLDLTREVHAMTKTIHDTLQGGHR